jgi:hypothetical protein
MEDEPALVGVSVAKASKVGATGNDYEEAGGGGGPEEE